MNMDMPAEIDIRRRTTHLGSKLAEGDLADIYSAYSAAHPKGAENQIVLKIARERRDNDLLENEVAILNALYPPTQKDEKFYRYLPRLIDSTRLPDGRHVSVFPLMEGYVSMAQVMAAFPLGIDFRDMVWMYKRLLSGLGFVHEMGFIHGAILPAHVLVHPTAHGAKIIDWSYALNFAALVQAKAAPPPDPPPPPAPDPYTALPGFDPSLAVDPLRGMGAMLDPARPAKPVKHAAPSKNDPPKKQLSVWSLLRQNNYDDDPVASPTTSAPVDPNAMYVKALSVDNMPYYAPEILRKETPRPATDIYMAAKCAIGLLGGDLMTNQLPASVIRTDPEGLDDAKCRSMLQAFFQLSLLQDPRKRPDDAWQLHEDFDKLLRGLVGPNKYREFFMPPKGDPQ